MSDDAVGTPGAVGVGRDYELADELDVSTPERMKALGDPLRSHICDLVLERAMSVTELAERTGRPRGSIAYHVDLLVDAGLVRVVRTRRVRAIEERLYGRTARTYVLSEPDDAPAFLNEVVAEMDLDRMRATAEELAADPTLDRRIVGSSTYRHARIPRNRVIEYSRRLEALALEFIDEPRDGDVEYGMLLALFPTNRRPHSPPEAGRGG